MIYYVFDEAGNWFLRNDKGQFASPQFPTYDDLLEYVESQDSADAEAES